MRTDTPLCCAQLCRNGQSAVGLKRVWTSIAQVRMQPHTVIEYRHVVEDVGTGFLGCLIAAPMDPLELQGAEEALDDRVVLAVPFAAHTALDAMCLRQLPTDLAGILHAAVRMVDQLPLRRPRPL